MNPKIKALLVIAGKHAVNAALLSAVQIYHDPMDNNFHTWHGVYGLAWLVGGAIVAREISTFLPKILSWSQSVPPTV